MSNTVLLFIGMVLAGVAFILYLFRGWASQWLHIDPPSPDHHPHPHPEPPSIGQLLLIATNEERAKHAKKPLTWNDKLGKDAKDHSDIQANNHHMSHFFAGDGSPGERIKKVGYDFSNMGENVAWNQASVKAVLNTWMWSPGHRMNILGNFSEFGGWGTDLGGGYYWTQVFGSPRVSSSLSIEESPPENENPRGCPNNGRIVDHFYTYTPGASVGTTSVGSTDTFVSLDPSRAKKEEELEGES